MRAELILSDSGRRGAEILCDGIGEVTIWKKKVTRDSADAFDEQLQKLTAEIRKISAKLQKVKGADEKKRLSSQLFDVNAEFICARVDGLTPEMLRVIDVTDIAEISMLANRLYENDFAAKKNE